MTIIRSLANQIHSFWVKRAIDRGELTMGRQEDGPPEVGELTRRGPKMVTKLGVVVWRKEGVVYRVGEGVSFRSNTITLDGCSALARAFVGECEIADFRFHGAGTNGAKEMTNRPTLVSEVGIRGSGVNRLIGDRTVQSSGIVTFEDFHVVREWGLFNRDGVMFDRMLTPEIVVGPGECLQFDYELTFPVD